MKTVPESIGAMSQNPPKRPPHHPLKVADVVISDVGLMVPLGADTAIGADNASPLDLNPTCLGVFHDTSLSCMLEKNTFLQMARLRSCSDDCGVVVKIARPRPSFSSRNP